MANFREKAIWIWNDESIGTPSEIVAKIKTAGFEAVYLHSTRVSNWRTPSRIALASALKAAGIFVYASVAVYGDKVNFSYTPQEEGQAAALIVNQYGLSGAIFDIEKGLYETSSVAPDLVRQLFSSYKQATSQPSAFCWWMFWENPDPNVYALWHNPEVLRAGMEYADVGMPMAYWFWGDAPSQAIDFLNEVWRQWRLVTNKPIVPGGRAYNGDGGTARPDAILAYEARARQLGAVGITWWVADLAIKLPDVWNALTATPKFNQPQEEPIEDNVYKNNALLYFTNSLSEPGWANSGFSGFVAHGLTLDGVEKPNQELTAMETKAAEMGKRFIISVDFTVKYYTGIQLSMQEELWPPMHLDYPLQQLTRIAGPRNPDELWIRFVNGTDHTGGKCDPDWLDYGLRMFLKKFFEWKKVNKPNLKVRIITSWNFMETYVNRGPAWLSNYATGIRQEALPPLDASYPRFPDDKPFELGAITGWKFWWYTPRLVMFNGTAEALATEFGAPPVEPPVEPEPDPEPDPKLIEIEQRLKSVENDLAALKELLGNWLVD